MVKEVNTDVKSKNPAKDPSGNVTLTSNSQKTLNNTKVTIKRNKKLKKDNIGSMMDPHITIFQSSKDYVDGSSKKFMLKTIHTGVSKRTSNVTAIEFYDTVMDGVTEYHTKLLKYIEINKKNFLPPHKS